MTKKKYKSYQAMRRDVLLELTNLHEADCKRLTFLERAMRPNFSLLPSDYTTVTTPELARELGYSRPTPNLYRVLKELSADGVIHAEYVGETNTGHDVYEYRLFAEIDQSEWIPTND